MVGKEEKKRDPGRGGKWRTQGVVVRAFMWVNRVAYHHYFSICFLYLFSVNQLKDLIGNIKRNKVEEVDIPPVIGPYTPPLSHISTVPALVLH